MLSLGTVREMLYLLGAVAHSEGVSVATAGGRKYPGIGSSRSFDATPAMVRFIDRWIYVMIATLFVATALAGFIPASIFKVTAMQAGERPWFPLIAHVHALLMGAWLLLLLLQSWLMATHRHRLHWEMGMLSLAVVPAMLVAGAMLVVATHQQLAITLATSPPAGGRFRLMGSADTANNILLTQMRMGIVFVACVAWAVMVRRTNPGVHKRLMFLGTAALLPPAFARIVFLPNTMPDSPLGQDLYMLLWISPMLLWDLYRERALHRAYLIWLALFVPPSLAVYWLWGDPAWMALAPRIVGTA
jgi:hypothetical protein